MPLWHNTIIRKEWYKKLWHDLTNMFLLKKIIGGKGLCMS